MDADEHRISKDFRDTSATYFAERIEYESVHALLLHWRDTDLKLNDEITELRSDVFEKLFKFRAATFPIPSDNSQDRVHTELSSFVSKWSRKPSSLIIVYYAGHAAEDSKGGALLKAFPDRDDPALSWTSCHGILFGAPGDVLLILDCCEAALASRASNFSKKHGRFQVLAAASKGISTPGPGVVSFTSFLIRELKKNAKNGITVRELADKLWENHRIKATPHVGDMVHNMSNSIFLQTYRVPLDPAFASKPSKPSGYVMFRASLTDDLTGLQIADWLKTAPPKAVTAVDIEAVVLQARQLQHCLDGNAFPPNSIFRKLSVSAQNGILRELRSLNNIISTSKTSSETLQMETDGETITQAYESIEKGTMAASSAVETTLLFNLNQADMENAIKDKGVIPEDAQEMLSLRQALLQKDIIYSDLEVPRKDLNIAHRTDRFLLGHHEEQNILVELIKYDQNESTGKPYRATVDQVRRMTALLCHPKRVSFHILPCIGFTHDPLQSTFGLVFEHPPGHDAEKEPVRLSDLYRKKETKTMPLGHRVKLAYALAAALESFHRVGWIHKNFRSDNVVFLEKTKQQQETEVASVVDAPSGVVVASAAAAPAGKLDLAEPWLFGFEYARAEDAGTNLEADFLVENNVYRHPDRWYMPKKKFTKPHDVYSLGVVLFEIAMWNDVYTLTTSPGDKPTANHVLERIMKKCQKVLPHQVGEVFTETIQACLRFGDRTKDVSEYEAQIIFQREIKDRLQRAVGRV